MENNNSERCFLEWMQMQEADVEELLQTLTLTETSQNSLTQLIDKMIKQFEDYIEKRIRHAQNGAASAYFAPTWNSALENSLLWLGGCRPTIFIRLLYALWGSEVEANLQEYIQGIRRGNLDELSSRQLVMVNELHLRTIKEEEKLTTKLACLQEYVADQPISLIAKNQSQAGESNDEEADRALADHDKAMGRVIQDADNLRLSTLKEIISILSPIQAVEYLAVGKKLHLCVHHSGKSRDLTNGTTN